MKGENAKNVTLTREKRLEKSIFSTFGLPLCFTKKQEKKIEWGRLCFSSTNLPV
jgi:hypothetical protein